MLKKIYSFLKTKITTTILKNTSIEDQYNQAGLTILKELETLRKRDVTSRKDIVRCLEDAEIKAKLRSEKDQEILHLRKTRPDADVSAHLKLALLYKRTEDQLRLRASKLEEMRLTIATTVVKLSDKRDSIQLTLELIRETNNARAMGLNDSEDIIEHADLAEIDIDSILSEAKMFKGDVPEASINTYEMADYLSDLESK